MPGKQVKTSYSKDVLTKQIAENILREAGVLGLPLDIVEQTLVHLVPLGRDLRRSYCDGLEHAAENLLNMGSEKRSVKLLAHICVLANRSLCGHEKGQQKSTERGKRLGRDLPSKSELSVMALPLLALLSVWVGVSLLKANLAIFSVTLESSLLVFVVATFLAAIHAYRTSKSPAPVSSVRKDVDYPVLEKLLERTESASILSNDLIRIYLYITISLAAGVLALLLIKVVGLSAAILVSALTGIAFTAAIYWFSSSSGTAICDEPCSESCIAKKMKIMRSIAKQVLTTR